MKSLPHSRHVLNRQKNTEVVLGEVTDVDTAAREVVLKDSTRIPYDTLIVATGSTYHYFGHSEWAKIAPGLKTIEDAVEIRARILLAFERAERAESDEERRAFLTFVVVGGGPTGVELAGALGEISRDTLKKDFHKINPTRIYSSSRARPGSAARPMHSRSSRKSGTIADRAGIQIRAGSIVTDHQ